MPSFFKVSPSSVTLPRVMGSRFSPLDLPSQLHDLPQNYTQRIKIYGADITTQQHLDQFNDFIDLEEVDDEDVKMRLFAKRFSGEVKKWFRSLPTRSIHNFQQFESTFIGKWEDRKKSSATFNSI